MLIFIESFLINLIEIIAWNIEENRLESGTKFFENLRVSGLFEADIEIYIEICLLRCLHNLSLTDPHIV